MALTDNLVSYWKLDSNSNDSVTTNNGTDTDISYATAGKLGNSATFNGSSSEILLPSGVSVKGLTAASLSMWFNKTSDPSAGQEKRLYYESTDATGFSRWSVRLNDAGTISIIARDNSSGNGFLATSAALSNGVWYHLCATYDSVSDNLILYINGVAVATNTTSKGAFTNTDAADQITIGNVNNLDYFTGYIDEVGIWSRALTADEVSQLYNSGNGNQYPFSSTVDYTLACDTGTLTLTGYDATFISRTLWTDVSKNSSSWTNQTKN